MIALYSGIIDISLYIQRLIFQVEDLLKNQILELQNCLQIHFTACLIHIQLLQATAIFSQRRGCELVMIAMHLSRLVELKFHAIYTPSSVYPANTHHTRRDQAASSSGSFQHILGATGILDRQVAGQRCWRGLKNTWKQA